MSDSSATQPASAVFLDRFDDDANAISNRYTQAAWERHKREGLELAVRTRWIALAATAVFLVYLNPKPEVLYYHFILALLSFNGWLIRRFGRVGLSRVELVLIFVDLAIMTVGMVIPNPFREDPLPIPMQYHFDNFQYFFIILAGGTLAFSWRTVVAIGTWTAGLWTFGWVAAWYFTTPVPGLSEKAAQAFDGHPTIQEFLDPNSFMPPLRLQEVLVFVMVALTLAVSVRRFNWLLLSNAGLERERANLSRYFSPNVVDELSQNDEPLKQVRNENIAVLFADIVGFTRFSADRDPNEVIDLLRGFHARMEAEVFRYHGTLDKYLGDGLMATFGTPVVGDRDASNALECAIAMVDTIERWNLERRRAGEPEIQIGIGLHFGSAVLGDIGANRLEFAVIGNTVNVAARIESLTRSLTASLAISDELRTQVLSEATPAVDLLGRLTRCPGQEIRGISQRMTLWVLPRSG